MKKLVCIICPKGCELNISVDGEEVKVSGNQCSRGEKFAVSEQLNPMRTICSTVRTVFATAPVLPVRVSADIPKNKIFEVMKEIDKVVVSEPVGRGGRIINNVLGLGVDVIATSDILIKQD